MADFREMMKHGKRAERSVPICLRGDLVAEWEAAERELEAAQKKPIDSLAGNGVAEIVARIEALQAEMLENSQDFRLRALPGRKFRSLRAAHPPRRGDDGEIVPGDGAPLFVNADTFFPELIRLCTVDPVLSEEEWRELIGDTDEAAASLEADGRADEIEDGLLTDRQYGDLTDAAWYLNRGEIDIPFSRAALLAKRTFAAE